MKSARELAHELARGVYRCNDPHMNKQHSPQCDEFTAAIEARDREHATQGDAGTLPASQTPEAAEAADATSFLGGAWVTKEGDALYLAELTAHGSTREEAVKTLWNRIRNMLSVPSALGQGEPTPNTDGERAVGT